MKKFSDFCHAMMLVFILAMAWMCRYSDYLRHHVRYEVYDFISYLVVFGSIASVLLVGAVWMTGKIKERKEEMKKLVNDPFVL